MKISKFLLLSSLILSVFTIQAQKIFYAKDTIEVNSNTEKPIYSVYLLGDIKPKDKGLANLKALETMLKSEDKNSSVILLGDLVYPLGLPDSTATDFKKMTKNLHRILSTFDFYKGSVYAFPGNHDWARGRKQGLDNVLNLENAINHYPNKKINFLPENACPGPVEISLTNDITLVIFDTQWWLHKNKKPSNSDCGLTNKEDVFGLIDDILKRNAHKKVLFTAHHPLYSVGKHGGYFSTKKTIFPLTDINKSLYIPLPGMIYTGYRKYFGDIQDISHPEYKLLRNPLLSIFKKYPNVIYASGHEHNMQFVEKDQLHHIISGGGGYPSYIASKKEKTDFAYEGSGFSKLSYYANGEVWIQYFTSDIPEKIIFQRKLFTKPLFNKEKEKNKLQSYQINQDSITVKISEQYSEAGKFHRGLLGDNYRNIWNTKVKLPVFDIGKEKGGLTILKRGGGMQTKSIRLEATNKKQYVLRSVNKYVEKALPYNFRNTVLKKPVQDAISASHPFGAVTVPKLADAIGVMHTNPKIVWVPNDPRLGIYKDDLADDVFLFEERPSGNWKNASFFGNSKKIVSTSKTIKKTTKNHKHIVDQKSVLKARLFDMLINDWDRHDDQWRWATFKKDGKTIYRPIPRDRDQVYFVNQGFVMWLATRNWALRKFQGFDYTIKDIAGLNYNARYFDRAFLTELKKEDWIKTAQDIKQHLTDSIIHQAILDMPKEIYNISGKDIESKLRVRRDSLDYYAEQYYKVLANKVDVVGTNKNELFKVFRTNNGDTQVNVFSINEEDNTSEIRYSRIFKKEETKEIRLYGLKGQDVFKIEGEAKKGITIRVIGGKNKDSIIDLSKVKGLKKKTIVYDRKDKKNVIVSSSETKLKLAKNKLINLYNRKQFKYNKTTPIIDLGYNIDDGVFIGGGFKNTRYNFRDSIIHKLQGKVAFLTGAFELAYNGNFSRVVGNFDFKLNMQASIPKSVDNFYGLGNETLKLTDDKTYYNLRYKFATINPMLFKNSNKSVSYSLGAFYNYYELTDVEDRFVGDLSLSQLTPSSYRAHSYSGLNANIYIDTRDNKIQPKRGITWLNDITSYYDLENNTYEHTQIKSDLSFYASFNSDPRLVFALRFGGAKNFGDYEFFHANYLGGDTNLRGFRNNRFGGDSYVFQNSEIRLKITDIRSYVINGPTGITFFNDLGKVWYDNEDSSVWHNGYGIELWLVPFNFTVLSVNFNKSTEDNFVNFKFKYQF